MDLTWQGEFRELMYAVAGETKSIPANSAQEADLFRFAVDYCNKRSRGLNPLDVLRGKVSSINIPAGKTISKNGKAATKPLHIRTTLPAALRNRVKKFKQMPDFPDSSSDTVPQSTSCSCQASMTTVLAELASLKGAIAHLTALTQQLHVTPPGTSPLPPPSPHASLSTSTSSHSEVESQDPPGYPGEPAPLVGGVPTYADAYSPSYMDESPAASQTSPLDALAPADMEINAQLLQVWMATAEAPDDGPKTLAGLSPADAAAYLSQRVTATADSERGPASLVPSSPGSAAAAPEWTPSKSQMAALARYLEQTDSTISIPGLTVDSIRQDADDNALAVLEPSTPMPWLGLCDLPVKATRLACVFSFSTSPDTLSPSGSATLSAYVSIQNPSQPVTVLPLKAFWGSNQSGSSVPFSSKGGQPSEVAFTLCLNELPADVPRTSQTAAIITILLMDSPTASTWAPRQLLASSRLVLKFQA